jgi:hypothetical protein
MKNIVILKVKNLDNKQILSTKAIFNRLPGLDVVGSKRRVA